MSEIAEQVADVVAENVEEAIDGVVEVMEVVKSNPVALVAAGAVGLMAGAVGGYFLANKILAAKYEERIEEEMETARLFYANVYKVDEDSGRPLTPQEVLAERQGEEAVEAVRAYQGRHDAIDDLQNSDAVISEPEDGYPAGEPHDDVVDNAIADRLQQEAVERRNVFRDDTFDLEVEMEFRTPDKPYIITHDEFYAAEKNYDTESLTYYELDDVLCDERDTPMDDRDPIVGDDHLTRFGSGSKSKNLLFIRNERLETDYEITKSTGSYLEEVLGMPEKPDTLKHSNRSAQQDRRRAFRHGDG